MAGNPGFLLLNLHPALERLWSKYRTCSKVGNSGRNIAWNQRKEFMDLDVKGMHPDSPSRIDKAITMLGGLETADAHITSISERQLGRAGVSLMSTPQ